MKNIILLLSIMLITSCTTAKNFTDGAKNKLKNLGNNPCYDKETNSIKIGCKKD